MEYTVAPTIVDAARDVRAAVAHTFLADPFEVAANEAVAGGSPVVAIVEGMLALSSRANLLSQNGVNALASAAHFVALGGFWAMGGKATEILVAITAATRASDLQLMPDPRYDVNASITRNP